MAAKNFYDAVLVGLDLSTLLAGALLSKRGFRVLVLGQGSPWPSYELRGVRFPRAPFALSSPDSPALGRVFSELALRPLMQRRTRAPAPALQAVMPGHRMDFSRDPALFGRELDREFPGSRRFVEELWQAEKESSSRLDRVIEHDLMWPPERFLERREFFGAALDTPLGLPATVSNKWAARASLQPPLPDLEPERVEFRPEFAGSSPLSRVLAACIRETDGRTDEARFSPRTLRLLHGLLSSTKLEEGGLSGLFELLIDSIHTHNGSLRLTERVDALTVKRHALSSLHLFPSDEEIGCHYVLWGQSIARLGALLTQREELSPMFAQVGEPRASFSRFTLNLLLRAEAVPEGMAERVLLLGDEPLWIETQRAPADARGGRAIMTIEAQLPVREGQDRSALLAGQRERMLSQLTLLSPFLAQHIELCDSPHDGRPALDMQAGVSFSPDDAARRGPDSMETVYAFPRPRLQGAAALSVRTPIKRLLLCNTQVVPGLGLEGVFLTASSAARAVTRSLNRDWMNRGRWTKVEL
ncbi:MAG: Neurosporene desaturase [Myxococcaceae bacterium]|nr:Neurosporene desaturase [Myxococcaceae bacterium]